MKNQKAQEEIRNGIVAMFGIDKLPEVEQAEAIARIGKIIFQAVFLRVVPLLEESDLAQYETLVEKNPSPEDLLDFFFDKVPQFLQIVAEEAENFRKDSAEVLAAVQ